MPSVNEFGKMLEFAFRFRQAQILTFDILSEGHNSRLGIYALE